MDRTEYTIVYHRYQWTMANHKVAFILEYMYAYRYTSSLLTSLFLFFC